jgi:hypothetical protein
VIISVGTTAFPTKKWDGGNDPQTACVKTVETILQSIAESGDIPKKIVLLSSIGVERPDQMPFKLLVRDIQVLFTFLYHMLLYVSKLI